MKKKILWIKLIAFSVMKSFKSIKLKIVRANKKMKDKKEILNNSNSKLKSKLKQVKDPELKKTLDKLIQAYEKKIVSLIFFLSIFTNVFRVKR